MYTDPIRVLVIDDDYYVREAIISLVSRDARTRLWDAVASPDDAILRCDEVTPPPDLCLLDVRLAGRDRAGIVTLPQLRQAFPECHFLLTSVDSDDETVLAGIHAGADGFVCKNETAEMVVSAMVRVASGSFVLSKTIAERLVGRITELGRLAAEIAPASNGMVGLTEAVRRTLYLYAICGLSASQIADELQVSVNTVNSRLRNAFAAIGATSRTEAFRALVEGQDR